MIEKIEKIEAALKDDLAGEGQGDAFMELYGLKTALHMCKVIKAADAMSYRNSPDNRLRFWESLEKLEELES